MHPMHLLTLLLSLGTSGLPGLSGLSGLSGTATTPASTAGSLFGAHPLERAGAPHVHSLPDSYEEIRARELEGLLSGLSEHAVWCKKKKLWRQRALTYAAVLQLDEENAEAHRGLGHKRQRDGTWKASRKTEPVDRSEKALPECFARRAEVTKSFVRALRALHATDTEEVTPATKARIIADVIAVDPDDAWARGVRKEVKVEGEWIMMELANSATGRERLVALAAKTRGELKPLAEKDLTPVEASLELPFTAALEQGGVRVVGTVSREELEACASNLRLARPLLRAHVGAGCAYASDFTYFLLSGSAEQAKFLRQHPEVGEDEVPFLMTLESATLPGARHFGSWASGAARRLDSACRQAISNLLYNEHEITSKYGWALEGIGLYFTHKVTGTHLTWFVAPSRYQSAKEDAAMRTKLSSRDVDWIEEARLLLAAGKLPAFHSVVGRDVNRLSTGDLLLCNAVIAFFVEGRPGELPGILDKIGKGRPAHETFLEELGLDLRQFDQRFHAWLAASGD